MKIWFDLTNSPHVSFFKQLISELKEENHEVIVTSRPLSNTIPLLKLYNINFTVVGTHYGKNSLKKMLGFPIRIFQLYNFLKKNKPDIAIAQASYYLPVVAKLLGVQSIYTNDNEHAKGNWPAFLCANKIFLPEFLTYDDISMPFISRKKVLNYEGVKEGIYLWNEYLGYEYKNPSSSIPTIYIRLEPNLAQYYNAGLFFMDDLIIALKDKYNIVIIPREKSQIKHYEDFIFEGITVLTKPQPLSEIVNKCSLFIGAGGTMTREMAVIGVPTISIYQDKLLKVDKYLIEVGAMVHVKNLTADFVDKFLIESISSRANSELLLKGRATYYNIKSQLLNY
jgi:hypothetical protein